MEKIDKKAIFIDAICFIAGSLLYAVSINVFTAPNNIAAGGVTGISTMLNYLFGTPIGMVGTILNIPLFIWGYKDVGLKFISKTIIATFSISIAIDATANIFTPYQDNMLIVMIIGGVCCGSGLALIFMRGGTTGGTDLASTLINRRFRFLSLGKILFFADFLVVAASWAVYGEIESPFYAVVIIFVSTKVIDSILYGTDIGSGKLMFIISNDNDEIAKLIMSDMDRGVTALKSRGCYSNNEGEMLLCGVRRHEVHHIFDLIHQIDENAFIMVGDVGEIRGEGFKHIKGSNLD